MKVHFFGKAKISHVKAERPTILESILLYGKIIEVLKHRQLSRGVEIKFEFRRRDFENFGVGRPSGQYRRNSLSG